MADDDDTSAGLTPDSKPVRRRASRNAGPPIDAPTASAATTVAAPAAPATAIVTMDKEPGPEPVAADATAAPVEAEAGPVAVDESPGSAGARRLTPGWIVAVVLVVVLAAAAVWLLVERSAAQDRDAQRNAFVQTARQTVLNLTTIKPDTAKDDVDRILAGASGDFKAEFDGREGPFVSVVQQAGVTTVGKIVESGFESQDGNTAKVLVAARADVSTPDGTENGPRDFRMRVTVTDDGGTMTASKVEFVP